MFWSDLRSFKLSLRGWHHICDGPDKVSIILYTLLKNCLCFRNNIRRTVNSIICVYNEYKDDVCRLGTEYKIIDLGMDENHVAFAATSR